MNQPSCCGLLSLAFVAQKIAFAHAWLGGVEFELAPLEVLVLDGFFEVLGFDCCIGCSLDSFLLGFGVEMEVDFDIEGWSYRKVELVGSIVEVEVQTRVVVVSKLLHRRFL